MEAKPQKPKYIDVTGAEFYPTDFAVSFMEGMKAAFTPVEESPAVDTKPVEVPSIIGGPPQTDPVSAQPVTSKSLDIGAQVWPISAGGGVMLRMIAADAVLINGKAIPVNKSANSEPWFGLSTWYYAKVEPQASAQTMPVTVRVGADTYSGEIPATLPGDGKRITLSTVPAASKQTATVTPAPLAHEGFFRLTKTNPVSEWP